MYILFDIGGTKTRIAGSPDGKDMTESVVASTKQDPDAALDELVSVARDIAEDDEITAISGGVAGPVEGDGRAVHPPHLPQWKGVALKKRLQDELGVKAIYIQNDTALVGLGEVTAGAGEGNDIAAYITVSTGVGGARYVRGKIDESAFGFEPGHHILDMHSFKEGHAAGAPEGAMPGHFEDYISGTSMERRFGEHPREVVDPAVWGEFEDMLALGLVNVSVFWSPNVIVLGGAMIVKNEYITIDRIQALLDEYLTIFSRSPRLVRAELGDKGGLHGALAYLRQQLEMSG